MGPRNGFLLGITTPGSRCQRMEVPSGDRRLQGLECLQCVPPRTHCREDGLRGLAGRTVWGTRLRLPQRLVCAACGIEAAPLACGPVP